MPTQYYLLNAAAPYTPATIRGAWDQTAGAVTKALDANKIGGGVNTAIAIAETNAAADFDVLLGRWISGPLAAQTISGTINVLLGIFESAAAADMNWHLHIYVTQGDSDTPRGTLLSDYTEALGVNEWPTSGAFGVFKALNVAATLSALAISDGDRIVIEIGYVSREASATSRTGTLRYGTLNSIGDNDVPLADGVLNGTDVNLKAGFITFSNSLTEFASAVPVRLSHAPIEVVAAAPATATVRLSHVVVEVLSRNIPAVPDPTGDGNPGTGTDPAAGTSLCGITAPLTLWAELELDAGYKRWSRAIQPLNHPSTYYGGPKEPRILDLSPITHSLSDWIGQPTTSEISITVEDSDGDVRAAIAANTLKNKNLDIWVIDDDSARAASTANRRGSYLVNDWEFVDDMTVRLRLLDRLGEFGFTLNLSKTLGPLLDRATFPDIPTQLEGRAAPLPYGMLTDEANLAVGVVPVWYVGQRTMADNAVWYEGLVSYGPCTPLSVYGSDGGNPVMRVKLDPALYNSDIAFPGQGQWATVRGSSLKYVVRNGRRWTCMYFKPGSVVGEAFRNGTVPIVANVAGYEHIGDGTGNVITSLPRILVHLLNNFILQDPPGDANWKTIPTVGSPAYSIISTSTFETVKTAMEARIAGGYPGAFLINWDLNHATAGDWIARMLLGGDFQIYTNRHGQLAASIEDLSAASSKDFVDKTDVMPNSYTSKKDWSKWANYLVWDHMKRYPPAVNTAFLYDGVVWLFAKDINNDSTLSNAQRKVERFTYEDWVMRDVTLALPNNVAQRRLARSKFGPDFITATVDLCGTVLKPGDVYTVKHFAGAVSTARRCRLWTQTEDLMNGRVTLYGHDITDL